VDGPAVGYTVDGSLTGETGRVARTTSEVPPGAIEWEASIRKRTASRSLRHPASTSKAFYLGRGEGLTGGVAA